MISCSARLPVYTLLIGACIPDLRVLGFFKLGGVMMLSMYLLGITVALLMAWVFKKTLLKGATLSQASIARREAARSEQQADVETDEIAHAADLPVEPLGQHDAEALAAQLVGPARQGHLASDRHPTAHAAQEFEGRPAVSRLPVEVGQHEHQGDPAAGDGRSGATGTADGCR